MRERITYFLDEPGKFEKSQLSVESDGSLRVNGLRAAKEHRLTVGFDELPQEIWLLLKQCQDLHIRWQSSKPYNSISPLFSRVSPGLHVFVTPSEGKPANLLCPLLKKVFSSDLKCDTPSSTFIEPPLLSKRFSSSSSHQYYAYVPSLHDLSAYVRNKICHSSDLCNNAANHINEASYIDMDFSSISHALIINIFHASPDHPWTETIDLDRGSEKIEVGVLNREPTKEPEELSMSGFLTVVGEDDKPKATQFSFPSRHHPLPPLHAHFRTSFDQPTGLHPTLRLTFPTFAASALSPPNDNPSCALHAYLTLPSYLFIDKYQFTDTLFLRSHNLISLRSIAGETDLEAPDYVLSKWGSTALFELATPPRSSLPVEKQPVEWAVSIPLHLRYLTPTNDAHGYTNISVPRPVVFWACPAEEGTKMSVNPFDRTNLGYDGLFGERTMFYHVEPSIHDNLVEKVKVPVLDMQYAGLIEWGTLVAVLLGSAWVGWKVWGVIVKDIKEWRKSEKAKSS